MSAPQPAPSDRGGRLPTPTGRLVAVTVALAGLIAVMPPPVGLALAAGLVVGLLLVDAALAADPRVLAVARELAGTVPLGRATELTWVVVNPTGRPARVALADALAPSLGADDRRTQLTVPAGGRARASTTLTPTRRGAFGLGPITVRTAGPLRLATRQVDHDVDDQLAVTPSFRSRDAAALRIERGRILEVGLHSARGRGAGTDFDRLREYTPDDDTRRIDWAATARIGRPIVRTYREERNQHVLLLLDTGRTMAGSVEGVPRLDHAMDAVLALTTVATRLGDRVGLIAFGARVRAIVPPARRTGQLAAVTEAMFRLEAELSESGYRAAFAETLTRFPRRALLVLLTELASEAVPETLLPALPLLARDHVVVVGAVADPVLDATVAEEPDHAGGAYRAAAAVAASRRRQRTAELLRTRGAIVVDAPPATLAGRLADVYLDVKATGRL